MSTSPRAAFAGMFDDAAMFPPGNASAETALVEHLRIRSAWFADLVGPLLVPVHGWDAFARAHESVGGPQVRVVLIGTTTSPPTVPAGVSVVGFEVAVADVPLPAVSPECSLAAEISMGAAGGRVMAAVADQAAAGLPTMAKFRTGGTAPETFPSTDVLAGVISLAVAANAPLKLTAGLHHAVRFTDQATGFEHHGFLNVLVAFAAALAGADQAVLVDLLSARDSVRLVADLRELTPDETRAARRHFVSFGCCGVEDPIGDLVALELVDPSTADDVNEETG